MKRSVALVLTVVIFAAIAVCFLRPTPDLNPDFGYVPDVVVLGKKLSVTDCTGDTDVLRVSNMSSGYSVDGYHMYLEVYEPSRAFVLTTSRYKDGILLQQGTDSNRIDRIADGKRETVARSTCGTVAGSSFLPYVILGNNSRIDAIFPNWYEPGTYVITLNLREHIIGSDGTTGEELYSITHTLATIPEESGKPFDLVSIFSDNALMELSDGGYHSGFLLSLRGGKLYPTDATIEVSQGGRWTEFESPDGTGTEKPSAVIEDADEGINQISFRFNHNDPTADYRATIHFAEHSDGSGEQYNLTLNLRFK